MDSPKPANIATIWRRDLVNINKTRDNHLAGFGRHFNHTLFVQSTSEIGEHIERAGTSVVRLSRGRMGLLGFWLSSLLELRRINTNEPLDALILPIGEEPLLLPLLVVRFFTLNKPKIILDLWDVPGLALEGSDTTVLKRTMRKAYLMVLPTIMRKADLILAGVVPTPFVDAGVRTDRLILSENGINPEFFTTCQVSHLWAQFPESESTPTRLLYQGFLHAARGSYDMLLAVKHLINSGHNLNLLLVGPSNDGDLHLIQQEIQRLQLQDSVTLQDVVSSDEIPKIIAGADICLCPLQDIPKYRWSFPVKVYEYMGMSKPVVASNLPGTAKLITHRSIGGCLYEAGDTDQMTTQIDWLICNPEKAVNIAERGREVIMTKSWEKIIQTLSLNIATHIQSK